MSVTIRLARIGKTNAPAYKVVVSKTRNKRTGKYLDILGFYNPSENPDAFEIDKKKYQEWKNKGALSTEAVEKLIAGTYEYKVYDPTQEEASKESPEEESEKETSQKEEKEEAELEGEGEENK
jgi:small subunit ribosomal protein S16